MAIEVPEHLRTGPMADAARASLEQASAMASASNSVPRISLGGRQFKLTENGEVVAKFSDFLDVIIVGVEPDAGRMIKTWYANGYVPGAKEPPTCSSDDGISPSPWVQEKQNPTCSNCPKNQFGSATSPSGKATKACRDSKRIWVKLAPGNLQMGKPYEVAPFKERQLYGLGVTVASLKAFSEHGRALIGLGQGPAVCVTRLTFADTDYPQLEFGVQAWLDAETAPLSLELAAAKPWKIQYKNAGLALAMGEGEGGVKRNALPMAVPDHLKPAAQQAAPQAAKVEDAVMSGDPVEEAPQATSVDPSAIDDAIGKW